VCKSYFDLSIFCIRRSVKATNTTSSGYQSFAIMHEESEDLDNLFPERNTLRCGNSANASVSMLRIHFDFMASK